MKKNKKGITIISLIVTIIVLLILTAIIVTNSETGSDYKRYNNMCSDIKLIESKVLIYYSKYDELPTIELSPEEITAISTKIGVSNIAKVDTSKLGEITLCFGDEEDTFVIDLDTLDVYYLFHKGSEYTGIKFKDTIYYTD